MLKFYIKLFRPHQYLKNTFVFIGVIFSHQWTLNFLLQAFGVFIAFSLTASGVYIFNDLLDIEADRNHPTKRFRPLASGVISIFQAKKVMLSLWIISVLPFLIFQRWTLFFIFLAYIFMNIAYSIRLKHIVLLDVFVISAGFMLRILAGTIGLNILPTAWLLLCSMNLTLFLGFCKRSSEIQQLERENQQQSSRKVLENYNQALLNQLTSITATSAILSYGFYTVEESTILIHGTNQLIYTLPLVIYGIFRYLYLNQLHAKGTDTAKDLLTDKHLLFTGLLWILVTIGILI